MFPILAQGPNFFVCFHFFQELFELELELEELELDELELKELDDELELEEKLELELDELFPNFHLFHNKIKIQLSQN